MVGPSRHLAWWNLVGPWILGLVQLELMLVRIGGDDPGAIGHLHGIIFIQQGGESLLAGHLQNDARCDDIVRPNFNRGIRTAWLTMVLSV